MEENKQKLIKIASSRIIANIYNQYLSEIFYKEMIRSKNFDGLDFTYYADNYENISVLKFSNKNSNLKFNLATLFDHSVFDKNLAERSIERVSIIFRIDKSCIDDLMIKLKGLHQTPWLAQSQISDTVNSLILKQEQIYQTNLISFFTKPKQHLRPLATYLLNRFSLILDQLIYLDQTVYFLGDDNYSDFSNDKNFIGLQKEIFSLDKPITIKLDSVLLKFKQIIQEDSFIDKIYRDILAIPQISDELIFDNSGFVIQESYWPQIKRTEIEDLVMKLNIETESLV